METTVHAHVHEHDHVNDLRPTTVTCCCHAGRVVTVLVDVLVNVKVIVLGFFWVAALPGCASAVEPSVQYSQL